MIRWPAVIVFDGDTELTYIADEAAWMSDDELHAMTYRDEDRLVDSAGELYSLQARDNATVVPQPLHTRIELERFIRLVQVHAAASGECCIQKITFTDIEDGMQLVAGISA